MTCKAVLFLESMLLSECFLFSDVNECQRKNGDCQQLCRNTNGSFVCACWDGFVLNANGFQCQGVAASVHVWVHACVHVCVHVCDVYNVHICVDADVDTGECAIVGALRFVSHACGWDTFPHRHAEALKWCTLQTNKHTLQLQHAWSTIVCWPSSLNLIVVGLTPRSVALM